jgi:hypothetical protein
MEGWHWPAALSSVYGRNKKFIDNQSNALVNNHLADETQFLYAESALALCSSAKG